VAGWAEFSARSRSTPKTTQRAGLPSVMSSNSPLRRGWQASAAGSRRGVRASRQTHPGQSSPRAGRACALAALRLAQKECPPSGSLSHRPIQVNLVRAALSAALRPSSRSRRMLFRDRESSQVRDEQLDIIERRLLVLLEVEAEPAGSEPAPSVRAVFARPAPSTRAPRRSSRGRSLAR